MKRIKILSTIIVVLLTYLSCDPHRYYDYFITNNCQDSIRVEIKLGNTIGYNPIVKSNLQIEPDSTQLILSIMDYQPLYNEYVEVFFKEIIIIKGIDTSKINYVNKKLWDFKITSKDHADSYLTVNPEDFE